MIKDLIKIKQLPEIEEQLKSVSKTIDGRVENAKGLVCTEESVKAVKEIRASFNKDFKEFEAQRKLVKEQIMKPYNDFEKVYKELIADKFKNADKELKDKIDSVENELKDKKEQEVKDYFEEYKKANNIDFVKYEQAKINVTLSASMKSLKEEAKEFIDKITEDLRLIETQEHKAEILVEYKQTLNVSNAVTTVANRFKAIEEEKKKQEELKEQQINEVSRPVEIEETKKEKDEFVIVPTRREITIKLNLYDEQIEQLKKFLNLSNIEYESEDL